MENCVVFGVHVFAITYMLTHTKAYIPIHKYRLKKEYIEESAKVQILTYLYINLCVHMLNAVILLYVVYI